MEHDMETELVNILLSYYGIDNVYVDVDEEKRQVQIWLEYEGEPHYLLIDDFYGIIDSKGSRVDYIWSIIDGDIVFDDTD